MTDLLILLQKNKFSFVLDFRIDVKITTLYSMAVHYYSFIWSSESIKKVSVFNYLGELVIQKIGESILQINVEHLNKGIYIIQSESVSGNIYNGKFVKE